MINVAVQVKLTDEGLQVDLYDDSVELRDVLEVFNNMVTHSGVWPMQIVHFSPDRIVVDSTHLYQVGQRGSIVVAMPHDGFTYTFTPPSSTVDFDRFVENVYAYASAFSELCSLEVRRTLLEI